MNSDSDRSEYGADGLTDGLMNAWLTSKNQSHPLIEALVDATEGDINAAGLLREFGIELGRVREALALLRRSIDSKAFGPELALTLADLQLKPAEARVRILHDLVKSTEAVTVKPIGTASYVPASAH